METSSCINLTVTGRRSAGKRRKIPLSCATRSINDLSPWPSRPSPTENVRGNNTSGAPAVSRELGQLILQLLKYTKVQNNNFASWLSGEREPKAGDTWMYSEVSGGQRRSWSPRAQIWRQQIYTEFHHLRVWCRVFAATGVDLIRSQIRSRLLCFFIRGNWKEIADHLGKILWNLVEMGLSVPWKFNGVLCRNYCKYL